MPEQSNEKAGLTASEPPAEPALLSRQRGSAVSVEEANLVEHEEALARSQHHLGCWLLGSGERRRAVAALRAAEAIQARIVRLSPHHLERHGAWALTLAELARALWPERPQECRRLLGQAIALQEEVCRKAPQVARYQQQLAAHRRQAAALPVEPSPGPIPLPDR